MQISNAPLKPIMQTQLRHPKPCSLPTRRQDQNGVVLIVALIMLVIISIMASVSVRNATSSEAVSGNARTTQMATQAAEFALKFCAQAMDTATPTAGSNLETVKNRINANLSGLQTLINAAVAPNMYSNYPRALYKNSSTKNLDYWDGATSVVAATPSTPGVIVIPLAQINGASASTYQRAPECMVEPMQVIEAGAIKTNKKYIITARGFGPEVAAADANRTRPKGSEVWLQSTDDR